MQKMKGWKRELWEALTSVDRHVKKKAEEDHRELSDGEKKHSVKEFKQSYMPTREAARAVLDPRYAGHCLGTDINKLACEGLLSEAPSVLKVPPPPISPARWGSPASTYISASVCLVLSPLSRWPITRVLFLAWWSVVELKLTVWASGRAAAAGL
jgi:hypothetical protein